MSGPERRGAHLKTGKEGAAGPKREIPAGVPRMRNFSNSY